MPYFADSSAIARLMTQLGYATSADEMKGRLLGILPHSDYLTCVAELRRRLSALSGLGSAVIIEKDGAYGRLLALVVDER